MIFDKFKDKHIILASASPRRQELFKKLGINFTIKTKEIEENYPSNLKEEEITNYLAILKANAFEGEISENEFIVTSDTIVWYKNSALEKPKNEKQAIEMLQKLSGTHHKVITSVCIKTTEVQKVFFDTTIVHFKHLSKDEISFYIKNYKPFDKAGAYGIQEWIGFIGVTKIEGSYFNVMGLPVHKLYEELLKI
ncbi:Maf family nucleotide pyrophosphatase [Lutibacter sp.]|uniref:Maf family nucleotide pyrophosphatase n=1 Tax=Lutibacter sp. TaxID=1925666 RepID=UPI0025BE9815|nr:Maf family nucleotide pyrophosphatase [Lutibacter sp.]MCF6167039.1 Maf family nucleotide pyrophosphatase [Lutibacter sp.]